MSHTGHNAMMGPATLFDAPEPAAKLQVKIPAPIEEPLTDREGSSQLGRPSNRSRYKCGHCGTGQCHHCLGSYRNGAKVAAQLVKEGTPPGEAEATRCACDRQGHQGATLVGAIPVARLPELTEVG